MLRFCDLLREMFMARSRRKEIIVEWSEALGLQSSDALRIARNANLIPTAAPPRGPLKGKPPRKTPEKPS
jgi:hypothetical protein